MRSAMVACLAACLLVSLARMSHAGSAFPLIPGDLLQATVYGEKELSLTLRVPYDGKISFPLIGPIQAAGRTTAEVESEARAKLAKGFLRDPQVSIFVEEFAPRRVYIMGCVKEEKDYDLPNEGELSILQVIAMAGGFTEEAAKDQTRIFRKKSSVGNERYVVSVSISKITHDLDLTRNVSIKPDDIVYIPALEKIYVLGRVEKPDAYPLPADGKLTATRAIALAGGLHKYAKRKEVKVLREKPGGEVTMIIVDYVQVMKGDLKQDVHLKPGDTVFVPDSFW